MARASNIRHSDSVRSGWWRVLRRCGALLRTPRGALVLWAVGTLGVLAAVAVSGDIALLVFIADREMLVLIVESTAAYGIYAWRSGSLAVGWAMLMHRARPWIVTFHIQSTRWSV